MKNLILKLNNFKKNILLSNHTTFGIGGTAKYFFTADSKEKIISAVEFAIKNKMKYFILGGGGNLLFSDDGFDGIVIKIEKSKCKVIENKILSFSGTALSNLVFMSEKNCLTGLEWAAGIPGTIGGAVCNNSGAHNKSISDLVESIEALETENNKLKTIELNKNECQFSYRGSVFKKNKKYIILNVVLSLESENRKKIRNKILKFIELRKKKHPIEYPSAGSIFKNPVIDDSLLKNMKKKYPELENIVIKNSIPAGWIIENSRLKGKKVGKAMVSKKHCNFIVNLGGAKAEDVLILISLIKQEVRNKFGIQLLEEIEYVGF